MNIITITSKGYRFLKNLFKTCTTKYNFNQSLHEAVEARDCQAMISLIGKGVDVNSVDDFLSTPLHYAAFMRNKEALVLLIDHGADVNAVNRAFVTPLHLATGSYVFSSKEYGDPETMELLLERGADVNAVELRFGFTPLHFAVIPGSSFEAMVLLVENGAALDARDKDSRTPLHFARYVSERKEHFLRLAESLLERGINPKLSGRAFKFGPTVMGALEDGLINDDADLLEFLEELDRPGKAGGGISGIIL